MKLSYILSIIFMVLSLTNVAAASPEEDLRKFRAYFKEKFPKVEFSTYQDGLYAINEKRRETWEEMEDFAPAYTAAVELGKKLFTTPFKNGKTYASCFKNKGIAIKQYYPYFNSNTGKVKTLEKEINECREKNAEPALKYKKGNITAISAYMAFTSRGKSVNVIIPNDPRALKIYNRGRQHFYAKRGQLNFSCADCHMYSAGRQIRSELLSPALGHITHFPVWRLKWGANKDGPLVGLGTLHRRYAGCNNNIRAKPLKAQSDEYTALEYFHSYMSNGLKFNGPAMRQ